MKSDESVPAWLVAAALLLPLLVLSSPLIEIDDARYAEVPRAMAASGDWVLPTLDGMPYVEKPPLWYWLGAASIKAFGPTEAAARLPLLLLSVLGGLGVWWLGSWLYSASVGRAAAAATATTGLWLFLAHNATLDLPVSVFLLWTTALILRVLEKPADARWAAPAAWLAAALAFLTKGLISVLFPALWVCGLVVLFPKWRRPALKLLSPAGIALACAVAAPWFFAVQARRPDFFHVFFVEQHFQRFLTPKYGRGQPFWFYLAVVPAGLLPWTAPFLSGFARTARRPFADPRATALAAWIVGVAAFFTTSHSKLATYALPVIPHASLLAARALEEGFSRRSVLACRVIGVVLLAASVVAATLPFRLPYLNLPPLGPEAVPVVLPTLLGFAAAFLLVLAAIHLHAPSSAAPARALAVGAVVGGALALGAVRAASPLVSAKELGLAVRDSLRDGDEVWTYQSYLQGLPFYAGHRVDKLVYFVGEFHYAKREALYADRFGDDSSVASLPRAGGRTFVAMRSKERAVFETLPRKGSISGWREFGPWSLAEIAAR